MRVPCLHYGPRYVFFSREGLTLLLVLPITVFSGAMCIAFGLTMVNLRVYLKRERLKEYQVTLLFLFKK